MGRHCANVEAKSFIGIVALKNLFTTAACCAAFFPAFASADAFGTVGLSLNGETQTWYTIANSSGADLSATATFTNNSSLSSLSIQAHPEPAYSAEKVLSLTLTYYGAYETGKNPISTEVVYLTEGVRNPFYTSDGVAATPNVSIEILEDGENPGRVTGQFAAKICLLKELSGEPDPNDCKDISGRFDTGILIQ